MGHGECVQMGMRRREPPSLHYCSIKRYPHAPAALPQSSSANSDSQCSKAVLEKGSGRGFISPLTN